MNTKQALEQQMKEERPAVLVVETETHHFLRLLDNFQSRPPELKDMRA